MDEIFKKVSHKDLRSRFISHEHCSANPFFSPKRSPEGRECSAENSLGRGGISSFQTLREREIYTRYSGFIKVQELRPRIKFSANIDRSLLRVLIDIIHCIGRPASMKRMTNLGRSAVGEATVESQPTAMVS